MAEEPKAGAFGGGTRPIEPSSSPPEAGSKPPSTGPVPTGRPASSGGLKTVEVGKTYKLRASGDTAWWWKRKHDGLPEVTIVGKVQGVLGVSAGELKNNHHIEQLRDRSQKLPAQHPIAKDWDQLYMAKVRGRDEMVHPDELE